MVDASAREIRKLRYISIEMQTTVFPRKNKIWLGNYQKWYSQKKDVASNKGRILRGSIAGDENEALYWQRTMSMCYIAERKEGDENGK